MSNFLKFIFDNPEFSAVIVSAIIGIISLLIAIFTLCQNSKMIEESSRPIVSVYLSRPNQSSNSLYIILKNFGSSQALIKSIDTDIELNTINWDSDIMPFSNIKNSLIAPNQKYIMSLDIRKFIDKTMPNFVKFNIEYQSSTRTYKEEYLLNLLAYNDISSTRITKNNSDSIKNISVQLKKIDETLQNINEQYL